MKRPDINEYCLDLTDVICSRSTCIRRQYGALITKNKRIIATGYNGSASGEPNCCDTEECWREEHNIPHGQQYEKCVAIHAEANAITQAGIDTCYGATMYLSGFENGKRITAEPCEMCKRLIINSRLAKVYIRDENGLTKCIYKKPEYEFK